VTECAGDAAATAPAPPEPCIDELDARLHPPEARSDDPAEQAKVLEELIEEGLRAADAEEVARIGQEALPAMHEAPATLDEQIDNALPAAIFVAGDRKQQQAKKSRKKRNGLRRRARREEEMTVRELAVKILKWGMENGLSIAEVARQLFLSPCTLGSWNKAFLNGPPPVKDVGRKPELADKQLRRELITIFGMMGPDVGIPTLQKEFPDLSRNELERFKEHYKDAYIKNGWLVVHALRWLKPGTVWAMDFTEFPSAMEGGLKCGLAIRDLSSRCCLELLLTDVEDSKTVIDLLTLLFALHGAPLVIKADNGSPFACWDVVKFLKAAGVLLLLSPPHTPRYNGAIECGFFPIKNFAHLEAARNDRPAAWSQDDIFAGKCRFNAAVRPDDLFGRTPQEIFDGRLGVPDAMREEFQTCYRRHEKDARLEQGFLLDKDDMSIQDQAKVDRIAIVKALLEQDFLLFRRRRITPAFIKRKYAEIVGG
jgi:hypothetical protein